MTYIKLDYTNAEPFFGHYQIEFLKESVAAIHEQMHSGRSKHQDALGWLTYPQDIDPQEIERIQKTAQHIQQTSDILLVIGIGGSYLGARAAIEMLTHPFKYSIPGPTQHKPQILYVGQNLSSTYMTQVMQALKGKDFAINIISKSGTTTEPAIAFRIFRKLLEDKYGKEEARKRIIATTDAEQGALRELAQQEGYVTFTIPRDIGGRYSVLTPVGLLPMATAGIDIQQVLTGAKQAYNELLTADITENSAYQYAIIRNILFQKGMAIELFVAYEPSLQFFAEWWKQLFGESEGKERRGIFPASATFTTDLHSFGQYIQEGQRDLFETILTVKEPAHDLVIGSDPDNIDGLNYLAGKTVNKVNEQATIGALNAHAEGGVPAVTFEVPRLDAFTFGYLVYYFEKACAMSAYLFGVNPFDQPGVELYKTNMFKLLEKPGYTETAKSI
ncbi:glucose-6-phosphate isomerase [Sporosarcina trichiuri]|uniref:glucose-6-phosphate isomerase n=1 Tax=Sporosarcina trichiuri TaxID=3056445 RepID=UPI0025B60B8B|nr:glucose-6-phosphate isomerase [Sporosarcina sp. 0.2-SM1T-5]WJY26425.1 glucose-6-phosphate isomerase [Sporosarcina sp. 0.2-SM1T-5]